MQTRVILRQGHQLQVYFYPTKLIPLTRVWHQDQPPIRLGAEIGYLDGNRLNGPDEVTKLLYHQMSDVVRR
jgi:hypothetical protein